MNAAQQVVDTAKSVKKSIESAAKETSMVAGYIGSNPGTTANITWGTVKSGEAWDSYDGTAARILAWGGHFIDSTWANIQWAVSRGTINRTAAPIDSYRECFQPAFGHKDSYDAGFDFARYTFEIPANVAILIYGAKGLVTGGWNFVRNIGSAVRWVPAVELAGVGQTGGSITINWAEAQALVGDLGTSLSGMLGLGAVLSTSGPRGPARAEADSNLRELPEGQARTPDENEAARIFYRNNRAEAINRWEQRTGQRWPTDENGNLQWAEHPRSLANGGDPLYVEPGVGPDPNAPHMIPGVDGLTDQQRWGAMGPPARRGG